MNRATGSATSRWVNNSSKRHRDVPFKEIEPEVMPFVFPPVTFYQNMLDRLPTEPAGAPIGKQWKAQEKDVKKLQTKYEGAEEKFELSVKQLGNEKGRQRHILIRETLERYKNEQPVIDSERQLSGKMVDEEVKVALESTGYMTPQHMTLIDTVLTMPGATTEKEYERRIAAINAVMAVCDAEEGAPSRPRTTKKRSVDAIYMSPADPVPKR